MNTIHPFPAPIIGNDTTLLADPLATRQLAQDEILVGRRSTLRVMRLWSSSTLMSSDSVMGTEDEDCMSDITDVTKDNGENTTTTTVTQIPRRDEEDRLAGTACSMQPQTTQAHEIPFSLKTVNMQLKENVRPSMPTGATTTPCKVQEPSINRRCVNSGYLVPASHSLSFRHSPFASGDPHAVGERKPRWLHGLARFQFLKCSTSQRSINPALAWGAEEWEC
jgi:hypothetical protein